MYNAIESNVEIKNGYYNFQRLFEIDKTTHIPLVSLFQTNGGYNGDSLFTMLFYKPNLQRNVLSIEKGTDQFIDWLNDEDGVLKYLGNSTLTIHQVDYKFLKQLQLVLTHERQGQSCFIGMGTIIKANNHEVPCILMVKKGYERYVKLCYILNKPILEDCLEFWIDETLLENQNPRIIKRINFFTKFCNEFNIPVVKKQNILELIQGKIRFDAPTIAKQKENLQNFVKSFREEQIEKLSLRKYRNERRSFIEKKILENQSGFTSTRLTYTGTVSSSTSNIANVLDYPF